MQAASFIHLHLHTEYSLVDGLIRVPALVKACVAAQMPAVAVTDRVNLFAVVKFFEKATAQGIKPIIGAELLLNNPDKPNQPFNQLVLCQNQTGYQNLLRLISRAYIDGQKLGVPCVHNEWLVEANEGLLCIGSGRNSDIGQALLANNRSLAQQRLDYWSSVFKDRFYLEVVRTGRVNENEYNQGAVELAQQQGIPIVASNDVRFLTADDFEAHEARVCINQGVVLADPQRSKLYSEQQYLRNPAEMAELFADIPEALTNSVEIAKRCNVWVSTGKVYLPAFPTPNQESLDDFFASESQKGFEDRIANTTIAADPEQRKLYQDRLNLEIGVILSMGYAGYFLIVADFIRWARENAVPVGPGRGSGAGSLVAYALKITDLDPIQYELLFERFLNPERISMPDFDIDFCMDGRDRVIDYVVKRYGRHNVSQIITFGTMAARAVVRDVGRVLGHPYGFTDKIAKLIPFEIGVTLDKALAQEELLQARYDQEEDVKFLIDLAKRLEGVARNAGKHAGGVVIAPTDLTDFTPLFCEQDSQQWVSQFDKDDIEAIGLVKFDFLGLRTLTIIDWAVQTINLTKGLDEKIAIETIPLNDSKSFKLLQACATTGVFQLESRGMKDLIKRLKPDCFEEIIALVALFRPGPLQSGMVDEFIQRKHGRAKIEYLHPELEAILKPTYGVILYQEQVMQIAQVLAGYTLGGADILRRAMGKKKPEEMAKQRSIFIDGAGVRGINAQIAGQIFDLMEKFAGYGFNKSHSAAYALISYQTAWLKANYPAAFMASVLSAEMNNTDKILIQIEESKRSKLTVTSPDINQSHYRFTAIDDQTIVYGLGAIKGVGEAAIANIVQSRANKSFTSLFDVCTRIDLGKVSRRVLEALIKAGAFDSLEPNRASVLASLENALGNAEQAAENDARGQFDLFGFATDSAESMPQYVKMEPWSMEQQLIYEKEILGLYLTGHPLDSIRSEMEQLTSAPLAAIPLNKNQTVRVAGTLVSMRVLFNKRSERFAFIALDDGTARMEIAVFVEPFKLFQSLLEMDSTLVIDAEIDYDEENDSSRVNAKQIYTLEQARQNFAKYIRIRIDANECNSQILDEFKQILTPFVKGKCPIFVEYHINEVPSLMRMGSEWAVNLHPNLIKALENLLGKEAVNVCYR